MASSGVKEILVTYLMPEKCYGEFFYNFNLHVPCLKFVLNRVCGFLILLDTLLGQLLQLWTILWRGSSDGLSLTSVLLQLYAFSCPVVFAVTHNFPLFAWAERVLILAQTAAIVFLILRYRGDTLHGVLLLSLHCAAMFLLVTCAAASLISHLQSSILPALILSKFYQARANYCHGYTGQLSSMSLILSLGGALGIMFALWDSNNILTNFLHPVSACFSVVLVAQILYYRSQSTKKDKND